MLKGKKPVIYLGNPRMHEVFQVVRERVVQITEITARIINEQSWIVPLCPVAFTDQFAYLANMTEEQWREFVLEYLARCDGMIIVQLPGWERSKGIKMELNYCLEHGIPYIYAYPSEILAACKEIYEEVVVGKE